MKITGAIKMIQTHGRADRFVKKQLPNDWFLALEITDNDLEQQKIDTALLINCRFRHRVEPKIMDEKNLKNLHLPLGLLCSYSFYT
ncbi:hypothetical protein [Legionella pneumophila]